MGNLTGAVGDLYVTYLMSKMPDDTHGDVYDMY
jgi:hypothetical protein